MRANGLGRYAKPFGNLFAGFSRGQESKNFEFAIGELFVRGFGRASPQLFEKSLRYGRAYIGLATENPLESPYDLPWRLELSDVTGRPGFEDTDRILLLRMHAKHQHWQVGLGALDFPQDLNPAAARHRDIENHDVPGFFPDEVESGLGAFSLSKLSGGKALRQNVHQSTPKNSVIICDQNFHTLD